MKVLSVYFFLTAHFEIENTMNKQMMERASENPILIPNKQNDWESMAAFNPSVVKVQEDFHMVYRAMSHPVLRQGVSLPLSSIAYAKSSDGVHFDNRKLLITPDAPWECFGCEDPRITFLGGKYYIFYTALSLYPFSAEGIRVAVAISRDLKTIDAKYEVTPFNAKAMALFPEKVNGKWLGILTVHTDAPPAKIALAYFDAESDIWSPKYWHNWYASLDAHIIPLLRHENDHIECGPVPIKTQQGWLLIYAYIQNYCQGDKKFQIEAVLLDLENPAHVLTRQPAVLLSSSCPYELAGNVPNIVFPSGGVVSDDVLRVYYGAADTTCALAKIRASSLVDSLISPVSSSFFKVRDEDCKGFVRFIHNPIIAPRPELTWESQATFNPAVVYEDGLFHIVYRALSRDHTSVFGYATSKDGLHIEDRPVQPIYVPRIPAEHKLRPGNSGCEDPRITKLGDRFYMFYTAYNGYMPRVAYTSIAVSDFLKRQWCWEYPKVITPPDVDDKDACIFPRKIGGQYVLIHRVDCAICVNKADDLNFSESHWLERESVISIPQTHEGENSKFGLASPPIETDYGWILLYHRVQSADNMYKVGACLLDIDEPTRVLANADTLMEPLMDYEKVGVIPNVVFPCGAVVHNQNLMIYYGGADRVIGVARMPLADLRFCLGVRV